MSPPSRSAPGWRPEVGAIYSNGKGRTRRVLAIGREFLLYPGQSDSDCLRYEDNKGERGNMTINSFRKWAKGGKVDG